MYAYLRLKGGRMATQRDDQDVERPVSLTVLRTTSPEDDEAWWVAKIEQGLRDADAGKFASDAKSQALHDKWANIRNG
jgi:predicted transcriptional regulator